MSEKEKKDTPSCEEAVENENAETLPEKDPMQEKLEAAEQTIAELNDKLLRTLAEYDNFRKRSVKKKRPSTPRRKPMRWQNSSRSSTAWSGRQDSNVPTPSTKKAWI